MTNVPFDAKNISESLTFAEELLSKVREAWFRIETCKKNMHDSMREVSEMEVSRYVKQIPIDDLDLTAWQIPQKQWAESGILTLQDLFACLENPEDFRKLSGGDDRKAKENWDWLQQTYEKLCAGVPVSVADENTRMNPLPIQKRFMRTVFLELIFSQYEQELWNYEKDLSNLIAVSTSAMKPRQKLFTWLFASGSEKRNARAAFDRLLDFLESDSASHVQTILQELKSAEKMSEDDVWKLFSENPKPYMEFLRHQYPSRMSGPIPDVPYRIPEVGKILTQARSILKADEEIGEAKEKSEKEVVDAARAMLLEEAAQQLKTVPVEELNRARKGFRITTLKNAGYHTIYDVHAASTYKLERINGISRAGAYEIKDAVAEITEGFLKGCRVSLNPDERSRLSDRLMIALYREYRLRDIAEKLDRLGSKKSKFRYYESQLSGGYDRIAWMMASPVQRKKIGEKAAQLTELAQSEAFQAAAFACGDLMDDRQNAGQISELKSAGRRAAYSELPNVTYDEAWECFAVHSIAFYQILEELAPEALGNGDLVYGLPEELAQKIREENVSLEGLLCELRRYQEWGVKYILHQKRVLLGDEMGLGKTVQAIAAMVSLKNTGETHFLVVCPASVLTNWIREITKHSLLEVVKVHGRDREEAAREWILRGGCAVTTYEAAGDLSALLEEDFRAGIIVVDEAHYVKNESAKRSIHVRRLCSHSERILFMTGTALENKVEEMTSLIRVLQPQLAQELENMVQISSAPAYREMIAPVYYRRKREDVLTELPELMEFEEWCTLGDAEKAVYEEDVFARNFQAMRRVSWSAPNMAVSCKAERLRTILGYAEQEKRKVIVFSYFLDTISEIRKELGETCYGPINGSVSPARRQEILDDFERAPHGAVLLSQVLAGGTGLNIQTASVVVLCEPQLKPSMESQAISRAYRMGQTRNVMVFRLLCDNSVDERIMELLAKKQEAFDAFADDSVAARESIAIEEKAYGNLIQEEIDRINQERENAKSSDRQT